MTEHSSKKSTGAQCDNPGNQMIDDYLLGNLDAEAMESVESHYFDCDVCFQEMQRREKIIQHIKQHGKALVPNYQSGSEAADRSGNITKVPANRARQTLWIYAAAAVLLALLIYNWQFSTAPSPDDPFALYADNYGASFQLSPAFEARMDNAQRSNGTLKIDGPDRLTVMRNQLLFRRANSGEDRSLTLTVMNNQLQPVTTAALSGKEYIFREALPPGVYYWVIEDETTALKLGRFAVLPGVVDE